MIWNGRLDPSIVAIAAGQLVEEAARVAVLSGVMASVGSGGALGVAIACLDAPAVVSGPAIGVVLGRGARAGPLALVVLHAAALAGAAYLLLPGASSTAAFAATLAVGVCLPTRDVLTRVWLSRAGAELEAGASVIGMSAHAAVVVGPLIGGVLVAHVGCAATLTLAALVSLIACIALVMQLPRAPRAGGDRPGRGALGLPRLPRAVLAIFGASAGYYLAYGPFEAALPAVALAAQGGPEVLGVAWSVHGIGAIVGAAVAWRLHVRATVARLGTLAILWGLPLMVFPFCPSIGALLVFLAVASAAWGPYPALEARLLLASAPQGLHGSIFGLRRAMLVPASALGALGGGLLLDASRSPAAVIAVSSGACVLVGVVARLGGRVVDAGQRTTPGG